MWPFRRKDAPSLSILREIGGGQFSLGELDARAAVREAYKQNPTVYAAIQYITTAAKTVPWIPQVRQRDGTVADAPADHPVRRLLERPNQWHPWDYIIEHVLGNLRLTGRAYLYLNGPGSNKATGAPTEILPLPTPWVTPKVNERMMDITSYEVQTTMGRLDLEAARVVDVFLWDPEHPLQGQGSVQPGAYSIDVSNQARKWNWNLMRNTARPPGAFTTPNNLTDQQFERLRKQVHDQYAGALNAGKPMIVEGGAKWERTGFSPEEMDWTQGHREMKREIAVAMGVAPELLGDPEAKTYANALHARLALYQDTVLPMLRHFTHSLQGRLRQWWPDISFFLDVDQVPAIQESRAEYGKSLVELVNVGVLTRNEARAELGFDEIDGGDELLVPLSLVPIGEAAPTPPAGDAGEDGEEESAVVAARANGPERNGNGAHG